MDFAKSVIGAGPCAVAPFVPPSGRPCRRTSANSSTKFFHKPHCFIGEKVKITNKISHNFKFLYTLSNFPPEDMQKEKYEEWMSINEDIPVAATLTVLEVFQAIKLEDSDGDEYVEENPSTNAEMRPFRTLTIEIRLAFIYPTIFLVG
ncbi:hypothetical protein AVEN_55013-1 [Araneus ventricosus]|uniref:Uncharacterized protein n=1 Tax=Araneus ventricosus TaxID=182803 RepID=A0A4Y2KV40_ARAVE|nr:hypothetical protein AVEN_55013-1 [Araneus ventricosus]